MPFDAELRSRLDADAARIIALYPRPRSALLPLLYLVQAEEGYVSADGIGFCAEQLGLTATEVTAVASFYTMYKRQPVGEYHIGVCTTSLCGIMGGDQILAGLHEHLGLGDDEVTPDGKVSVEHVECNAACDYAPVMMVNWEFFDNMTPQSARELADGLRAGADVTPTRVAGPAAGPSVAWSSLKPARMREAWRQVHSRCGPRVGETGVPARRSSASARARSGVMLSKNSQLTIITGA